MNKLYCENYTLRWGNKNINKKIVNRKVKLRKYLLHGIIVVLNKDVNREPITRIVKNNIIITSLSRHKDKSIRTATSNGDKSTGVD